MKYDSKKVENRYDYIAKKEDEQEKNLTFRTELPRYFIKKYLKKKDIVLDAGGGTGINSIFMSKICKSVILQDISSNILKEAKKNIENNQIQNIEIVKGDISDLNSLSDNQFSFTICVGSALSYVIENRFKALKELVRVTKKNSIIIIQVASKTGFMRKYLKNGDLNEVLSINKTQITTCGMGPKTYVYSIEELEKMFFDNNCKVLEIASTPTITDTVDKKQYFEKNKWNKLKKLEIGLCTKKELLGIGNHLLFVVKKL